MSKDWKSRTYLKGYDLGDYLTHKDKPLEVLLKIKDVSNISKSKWVRYSVDPTINVRDDLIIVFEKIIIKEKKDRFSLLQSRWLFDEFEDNEILYSDLLKLYRPLTDAEKLFYTTDS